MNTTNSNEAAPSGIFKTVLNSVGPALIVASVVLGPGSLMTNTKVGAQYGYQMVWVLVLASTMMGLTVILGANIGLRLNETPCKELARSYGKALSVAVGIVLYTIVACFQFTNDAAVLASLEVLIENIPFLKPYALGLAIVLLVLINLCLCALLFGTNKPYAFIEKAMMLMVGIMILCFSINLMMVKIDYKALLEGLYPSLPRGEDAGGIVAIIGLFGTTYSLGGAFYQSYAVREKGWTIRNLRAGLIDAVVGIAMLGGISLMIMLTSAVALRDTNPESIAMVSSQLAPLLGNNASLIFCMGMFAAAFSSLYVNALIGGSIFSDGLGYQGKIDFLSTKLLTVLALFIGMVIAILVRVAEFKTVGMIVFAHAITVIGNPLLALSMLLLSLKIRDSKFKILLVTIGVLSVVISLLFSWRMIIRYTS